MAICALALLIVGCCNIIEDYFDRDEFVIQKGFEDFSVGFRLAADGDAICTVRNYAGPNVSVTVWDVNIFDNQDGGILCGQSVHEELPPGEGFTLELTECGNWVNGTRFEVLVEIAYDKHTDTGTESLVEEGTIKRTIEEEYIWKDK